MVFIESSWCDSHEKVCKDFISRNSYILRKFFIFNLNIVKALICLKWFARNQCSQGYTQFCEIFSKSKGQISQWNVSLVTVVYDMLGTFPFCLYIEKDFSEFLVL